MSEKYAYEQKYPLPIWASEEVLRFSGAWHWVLGLSENLDKNIAKVSS